MMIDTRSFPSRVYTYLIASRSELYLCGRLGYSGDPNAQSEWKKSIWKSTDIRKGF
jgi:hypothetical protein